MSEEIDVLRIVTERLAAADMPYMVTGSMALGLYAVPRMTRDIDLVVELSAGDADRVCSLFAADFYVDADAVRTSIAQRGTFNLIHETLVVKVDVVVRKDTDYRRTEFARRRRLTFDGHPLVVVAPEDLIISKLDWARDTRSQVQLGDVRHLLRAVPDLDRGDLEHWITPRSCLPLSRGGWMNDTSPEMEARYHAMLLARSGEERLRMAGSMFSAARRLAVAAILAADPLASPAAIRRALFLRFYGHEFDGPAHERILARIGRAATERPAS